MTEANLVDAMARAIARKEGFYKTGKVPSVAQRLHNPLNLVHWKDPTGQPYPEVCGYVQFPDDSTGWRAGRAQVRINVVKRGLTWREFFAGKRGVYKGFDPARGDSKQDPSNYAREVLKFMGVEADLDAPIINQVAQDGESTGRLAA